MESVHEMCKVHFLWQDKAGNSPSFPSLDSGLKPFACSSCLMGRLAEGDSQQQMLEQYYMAWVL
jgi:hypothetical protein